MASVEFRSAIPSVVEQMDNVAIPSRLQDLIDRYETVTRDRDELLWKWLYYVFPRFELSCVAPEHRRPAREAKFCLSFYMTILDDLSERHRDKETFEQGRNIPFSSTTCRFDAPGADREYLSLLGESWALAESRLAEGPRHDQFRELFEFDLRQSLNAMDFNRLVNEGPHLASPGGAELYDTHNMLLYLYVDIDLSFSPAFDTDDLATLRDVTWEAQKLARIGNWVTTWERELGEDDWTSNVVIEAVDRGVVSREELRGLPRADVVERVRASGIEREHLLEWNRIYRRLVTREYDVSSVDLDSFVDGMRHLLEVDVKAKGRK